MGRQGTVDHDRGRSNQNVPLTGKTTTDRCQPLAEEIEVLQEQIAVLEEGLPQAQGMERAALFKEINEYRAALDARQQALYQCRGRSE